MKNRTVILGIDGLPYTFIKKFTNKGHLPNIRKLIEEGVIFKQMSASIPEVSSTSWSCIFTGKNPAEHGIYGFTDLIPGTYSMSFPNFKNVRCEAFWQREKNKNKKHVIINVPSTYPAEELNGFLVSGFVSLDLDKAVYPAEELQKLKEDGYEIDVDAGKVNDSKDLFLNELFKTLEKRTELGMRKWDELDWDVFFFVVTGTDRLEHFFWDAIEDENNKYHDRVMEFFDKTDEVVGKFLDKMSENDSLIMVSDHGMEQINYNVYLNKFLKEEGYLFLEKIRLKSCL